MRALLEGDATGQVLRLDDPLSMWGGLEPKTGTIVDRRHPQVGAVVTGRVLVMPNGRGSSSSSSVLAEAIRIGTGPAAIVLREPDVIVLLGALVAEELYGITCPVVVPGEEEYARLTDGTIVTISGNRLEADR